MNIRLHQFEYSHFNEKARWALDYKGVDHERICYLPGPHMPAIKKISGQTQTPVLELDGRITPGSAAIIDVLEQHRPQPALYPADPALRSRALELQARFDTELGPPVRTIVFDQLLRHGAYLSAMFARSKTPFVRGMYRLTLPAAKGLIAKANGADDPQNVTRCHADVKRWLDEIAGMLASGPYLVGGDFSVADLTAAALIAPIADVAHPDMQRPQPVPTGYAELVSEFADHPTIGWVKDTYARHRPA